MTITDRLPPEILTEIVAALRQKDQLSLCLVSQLWSELCLHAIYRLVDLPKFPKAKVFVEGIQANPARASAIQSFTVDQYVYSRLPDEKFIAQLANAIALMTQLQRLSIPAALLHHLEECVFSSLVAFICNTYRTEPYPVIISFLKRHPGLTNIDLSCCRAPRTSLQHSYIQLPSLQRFYGEPTWVPALVTQQLRIARLRWYDDQNVEQTVIALRSLSNPDQPFHLINSTTTASHQQWMPLVETLAMHFPNMKTLHMRARGAPDQETLDHLTAQLPRFKMLSILAIDDARSILFKNGLVHSKLYALVATEWASVCPTLEACCIAKWAFRKATPRSGRIARERNSRSLPLHCGPAEGLGHRCNSGCSTKHIWPWSIHLF
ncbi:hypothetical protein C8R45DRAFT_1027024 [Mycena sanguinolenta]|nr:hypothetical protein C8R45DRAFT_1027024 [Mycena sanguinolenta]